jgi:hypothetical protein
MNLLKNKFKILENKDSNSEELIQKLKKIKNIFSANKEFEDTDISNNNLNTLTDLTEETVSVTNSTTTNSTTQSNEKFYLISAVWAKNMVTFIERLFKYQNSENFLAFLDRAFNKNNVLSLYFSYDGNSDLVNSGIYPAEINNFFITQFKDSWIDPEDTQSHSNIYIKKCMKENTDFFYVNEKEWNMIKELFGYNYEIVRRIANISNNQLIEVNLKKVKMLLKNIFNK